MQLCSWYWYKLAITGRLLKRLLQISKVYFKVKPGRPGGPSGLTSNPPAAKVICFATLPGKANIAEKPFVPKTST